jgi:pimeloyl-ACP methyl ester carboxylesterase
MLLIGSLIPSASAEDSYFDSNGVQIAYSQEGDGVPVILLHGISGNRKNWLEYAFYDALVAEYKAIAIDSRGHGDSEKPHDEAQYGTEMAFDVIRLMDQMSIERAHIVGYSMGAIISGYIAINYPDRVHSVTLVAAAPFREKWSELQDNTLAQVLEIIRARDDANPQPVTRDYEALGAVASALDDLTVSDERLSSNEVPTFGIVGTADPRITRMQDLGTVMSNYTLEIVEGATHSGPDGLPRREEFAAKVKLFIDQVKID